MDQNHSFVDIKIMTPPEIQHGGKDLMINYDFQETPFGEALIASTSKGVCYMAFTNKRDDALKELKVMFPKAVYRNHSDQMQENAISVFTQDARKSDKVNLHIKGTDFQLEVWSALLKIPKGQLVTYGDIAQSIDKPKASRAVGSAVGSNSVAFLIPCHRVVRSTGALGEYRWGASLKKALIEWEGAKRP